MVCTLQNAFLNWLMFNVSVGCQAIIPALCMNVYIVGLNQLYDIEIDKVTKPLGILKDKN